MRSFTDLSEQEILALAIRQEDEDSCIYADLADGLRKEYPEQAKDFDRMRVEEEEHRDRLKKFFRERFGDHIPMIRRQDVRGFIQRKPIWRKRPLSLKEASRAAESMEAETGRFYEAAARRTRDEGVRQLLLKLAEEERKHERLAGELPGEVPLSPEAEARRRLFVLQIIQPGLAGLMDGSVSTLAPLFAAAFATKQSWETFVVGLAAALGAGISMGFAEALSDDGKLTGRGHPLIRGIACGLMTAIGGLGHTLPYLIHDIYVATAVACAVVIVELAIIAWIRHHYMDTPWTTATIQVVLGGVLVFLTGILIGSS